MRIFTGFGFDISGQISVAIRRPAFCLHCNRIKSDASANLASVLEYMFLCRIGDMGLQNGQNGVYANGNWSSFYLVKKQNNCVDPWQLMLQIVARW